MLEVGHTHRRRCPGVCGLGRMPVVRLNAPCGVKRACPSVLRQLIRAKHVVCRSEARYATHEASLLAARWRQAGSTPNGRRGWLRPPPPSASRDYRLCRCHFCQSSISNAFETSRKMCATRPVHRTTQTAARDDDGPSHVRGRLISHKRAATQLLPHATSMSAFVAFCQMTRTGRASFFCHDCGADATCGPASTLQAQVCCSCYEARCWICGSSEHSHGPDALCGSIYTCRVRRYGILGTLDRPGKDAAPL